MDDQAVHNSVQTIPLVDDAGVVTNERASRPVISRKRRASQSLYSTEIETPRPESVGPIKVIGELEAYLNEPGVPMEVPVNPIDPESELHATKPLEHGRMIAFDARHTQGRPVFQHWGGLFRLARGNTIFSI